MVGAHESVSDSSTREIALLCDACCADSYILRPSRLYEFTKAQKQKKQKNFFEVGEHMGLDCAGLRQGRVPR